VKERKKKDKKRIGRRYNKKGQKDHAIKILKLRLELKIRK
jgi:hypothetical protein